MSIEFIKTRAQDGTTWLWVESTQWLSTHQHLLSDGAVRFEWLTATHNLGDEFVLTTCVANETLTQRWIINSTVLDARIDSVVGVYPLADFHEREVEQMFGVMFNGVDSRDQLLLLNLLAIRFAAISNSNQECKRHGPELLSQMRMLAADHHFHQVFFRSGQSDANSK